jgi:hypothetical protein
MSIIIIIIIICIIIIIIFIIIVIIFIIYIIIIIICIIIFIILFIIIFIIFTKKQQGRAFVNTGNGYTPANVLPWKGPISAGGACSLSWIIATNSH